MNNGNIFQVNIGNSNIDITPMIVFVLFHEGASCAFHFPLKKIDQKKLEHVIIVSNTIKTSSRFISLIRVPVPFPFARFRIPCFPYARRWHAFFLPSGQGIPRMLQEEILVLYRSFVSLQKPYICQY